MEVLQFYPCLLKSPDNRCLMLLHVDDILVVCDDDFLGNQLLKTLNLKNKVSAEVLRSVGDSLTFSKRRINDHGFQRENHCLSSPKAF